MYMASAIWTPVCLYAIDQFACRDKLSQFPSEFCICISGTPAYLIHRYFVFQPAFSSRIRQRSVWIGRYNTIICQEDNYANVFIFHLICKSDKVKSSPFFHIIKSILPSGLDKNYI